MDIFWLFIFYSFGGYLLEKAFAFLTAAPLQVRKCLLLLPLCPVYGLGMLAVLALPVPLRASPWALGFWGALAVTAGEFVAGLLVNRSFAVWDYRAMPLNVMGQICLPYSLLWMPVSLAGMQIYDRAERKLR